MSGVWIPTVTGDFSLVRNAQTCSGAQPATYVVGTRFFPTGKTARELKTDRWLPSSAEIKKGWSYNSAVAIRLHVVDTYKFYPPFTCRQWVMWHRTSIRTAGTCLWCEAVTIRLHSGPAICWLTAVHRTEFHSTLVNVLETSKVFRGTSAQMQGLIFQKRLLYTSAV